MEVESPTRPTLSPLRFFNRTARINQEGPAIAKEKLTQIDGSLKKILSIRERSVSTTKIEEEKSQRVEKENKFEAGKFFVRGIGKLANRIPGKNTVQKFLIFMAFGWLFNTFSKYFGEISGPLSNIIMGSVKVIDAFSKIAFGIFDGFVTFIDIGYKTWDMIRGTGDSQKLQSALDNVLLDIDSFFGGILSLLGIVERPPELPPEQQGQPGMPGAPTPGGPGGAPSSGNLPRVPGQPPQAPPSQVTGGIIPSQARITSGYGAQESFRKGPHSGIDYGYDVGTPISLVKSGVVVEASTGYNGGYGNFVLVQHSNGTYSMFNHLDKIYVQKGQKINASQGNAPVIGTIGNTGASTGPHLDFKVATKWDGYNPGGFINPTNHQDSVFRIGGDVKVKPSQIQKLGKKNGKEGVIINGQWRPKAWTGEERARYDRVTGQQQGQEQTKVSPTGGIHKRALDVIGKYESDSVGGYNAVNQIGTQGGRGTLGFSGDIRNMKQHGGRALTDMTIAEIMALQAEGQMSNDEWIRRGKLHAVGRYQFIGNTLPGVVARSGIPTSAKFTPEVQDKLAMQYLKEAGLGAWVGPSDRASKAERAIVEQARKTPVPTTQSSSKSSVKSSPTTSTPTSKPERWAIDPRGWFGMKDGGMVEDIPKQSKKTDTSSLSTYPSYSEGGTMMLIQPIIIEKPVPVQSNKGRTSFPVIGGVNSNSMNNFRG